MPFVLVFVLMVALVLLTVRTMIALIIRQIIAQRATCGTTQASADRRAGCAAQAIAYQRSASRADPAAYRSFCTIALLSTDCSACGTAQACANRCSG